MNQIISIAIGGAVGAVLRFVVSNQVYRLMGRDFPYGTLSVNVIGSLFMGLLFVMLTERMTFSSEWRAFLLVGLLGAFTTFSTFSIETLTLMQQGELLKALLNIVLSVIFCLFAVWLGLIIGRSI